MQYDVIYNEDSLVTLSRMSDNSVDLIVTSPPYNKGWYADKNAAKSSVWSALDGRKIAYDSFNDEMHPDEYRKWQINVLSECIRVLKPTGSIFYNHKDVISKGLIIPPTWVYEFPVHQQIIWDRGGGPMRDPRYYMPITEYVYWIVKDAKKFYFDKSESAFRTNIWRINAERSEHPAPFPRRLVGNIIKCCSKKGDVVYDPFMGSGTTALAAYEFGRHYVGSEISERYIEMAKKRIENSKSQPTLF